MSSGVGRIVLQIEPDQKNPRNSEGSFIELQDGRLMFTYSKFMGQGGGDDARAVIAARYSDDNGRTWSKDRILFTPETFGALNIMSTSMLRLRDGSMGLFFIIRYGWHDARPHLFISTDEGETWKPPIRCAKGPGYYVTNNDRVVRFESGRIGLPTSYHRMRGDDIHDWSTFDSRGIPVFFYSDDDGRTWAESDNYAFVSLPYSKSGFQEAGVVQLDQKVLWQWFRTDLGCQYGSFSYDEGQTWSVPSPTTFTSPNSPMSVKRMKDQEQLLCVYNPVPRYNGRVTGSVGDRTPLCIVLCDYSLRRLTEPCLIETDENAGFCYTAIHCTEQAVLLAYCAGVKEDKGQLNRLCIRRIERTELE